ncbi:hypothetical protein [Ochrobactrum quorumnocens]|uniref:hypothetical protein n=1 Tax=Ochrobactrum quorumnocens TaxID=271865 RepID=UPI003BA06AAA
MIFGDWPGCMVNYPYEIPAGVLAAFMAEPDFLWPLAPGAMNEMARRCRFEVRDRWADLFAQEVQDLDARRPCAYACFHKSWQKQCMTPNPGVLVIGPWRRNGSGIRNANRSQKCGGSSLVAKYPKDHEKEDDK